MMLPCIQQQFIDKVRAGMDQVFYRFTGVKTLGKQYLALFDACLETVQRGLAFCELAVQPGDK